MSPEIARILDANLNRAREALRVIEEHARFVLNDAQSAATLKAMRHELSRLFPNNLVSTGLDARDVAGDVGRESKTAAETLREAPDDVARAAVARFSEAARALEEYGKLAAPAAAASVERLRYQAYALEPLLLARGARRRQLSLSRLYVILTADLCRGEWLATAEAALRGGAACLQLREKHLSDAQLLRRARALRCLTREFNALLIVNDRPDIARLSEADGVHLGQDDLSVADARRIAGNSLLIGKSTHTLDQARAALAEEPDYIAVGPMFDTRTKPQAHIAGPQTLSDVRALAPHRTLVAIGGINAENAAAIRAAGADCICVCAAVISAHDPEAAARQMLRSVM